MSRRRKQQLTPAQASVARQLGPLEGARIPGGCDHCQAYQTVSPISGGVWSLAVHHDDDCPFLAEVQRRTAS